MLIKYSLYNEAETKRWDDFIKAHPNGTPFHLTSWMKTIHETYSFKPILYVFTDKDCKMLGVLPCFLLKGLFSGTRIISNPFSDYCGPLFQDNNMENELFEKIIKDNDSRVKHIEIRNSLPDYLNCKGINYYKHHIIELDSDPANIFNKFNKKTIQYSIRKAERAGVRIIEENSIHGIEEFYRLNKLTRKKHGIPCQPKQFYYNLYKNMISRGVASIILAIYDSKAIAAGIFLKSNDTVFYKYNVSDPEFLINKVPNHLLTWNAIQQAIDKGCKKFDFGRTSINNKGLIRYKEMWGAKAFDLSYSYYPHGSGVSETKEDGFTYRMLTSAWRILPDILAENLGPRIFKHFG